MSAKGKYGYTSSKSFTEILLPFEISMSMLITDKNYITRMQWENLDFETTALLQYTLYTKAQIKRKMMQN